MFENHVLSWIIFIPMVGIVVILLLPKGKDEMIKWVSVIFTGIQVLISFYIYANYNFDLAGVNTEKGFQFVEHYRWIPSMNIEFFIGIDGISVLMVFLTAIISLIAVGASWKIDSHFDKGEWHKKERVFLKGYFALLLLLDVAMMGVFCAIDFFLFYVFWEVMLLPMFFLIGIWGGPNRIYAAIKFFLYTLFGSVLILIAILVFYFNVTNPVTGGHTFNMLHVIDQANHGGILLDVVWRRWIFLALFIGFAIKVPIFPFHTWLPDAHVEAPTAISVILAGVLLKMGIYGFMRINFPMLPDVFQWDYFIYGIAILGLINIIYGALCAMAQNDLKRLVAYSSISHMGYCLLGLASMTSEGYNGALFQMFNHGTVAAMLFLLVGVIYDRVHHRDIDRFGGIATKVPIYLGITSLAFFAALGLPGLSSFVSEFLVFLGAFKAYKIITIFSLLGVILTAAYMLWALQRIFFGKFNEEYASLPDISNRELTTLVPLGIIIIILGIYPSLALNLINSTMDHLIKVIDSGAGVMMSVLP